MEEAWKDVVGYEGIYMVSNKGRIKSLDRIIKNKNGIERKEKGRIKNIKPNKRGYMQVALCKNSSRLNTSVHRVVANAFIANTENKPSINHINGVRNDNNVKNIEWCNASENAIHALDTGLCYAYCQNHGMAKLTVEQVKDIRANCIKGDLVYGQKSFARKYNVNKSTIRRVLDGVTWTRGEEI